MVDHVAESTMHLGNHEMHLGHHDQQPGPAPVPRQDLVQRLDAIVHRVHFDGAIDKLDEGQLTEARHLISRLEALLA